MKQKRVLLINIQKLKRGFKKLSVHFMLPEFFHLFFLHKLFEKQILIIFYSNLLLLKSNKYIYKRGREKNLLMFKELNQLK